MRVNGGEEGGGGGRRGAEIFFNIFLLPCANIMVMVVVAVVPAPGLPGLR